MSSYNNLLYANCPPMSANIIKAWELHYLRNFGSGLPDRVNKQSPRQNDIIEPCWVIYTI